MCGVVGFIDSNNRLSSAEARKHLDLMSKTIVHRGPDSSGEWINEKRIFSRPVNSLGHLRYNDIVPKAHFQIRLVKLAHLINSFSYQLPLKSYMP